MKNEDLLGVPYKWRGTFPEGLDCFGLLTEIRRRCGISTPDFSWVYERWSEAEFDPHRMTDWVELHTQPTDVCPGALTLRDSWRGPALVTSDGTSAFYISSRLQVLAVPPHEIRGAQWRI